MTKRELKRFRKRKHRLTAPKSLIVLHGETIAHTNIPAIIDVCKKHGCETVER